MIKWNSNIIHRKITADGNPVDLGFIQRTMPVKKPEISWRNKCDYVRSQIYIRSHICIGCGSGKIFDKNNVVYIFTRHQSMETIKELVEKVRKINNE